MKGLRLVWKIVYSAVRCTEFIAASCLLYLMIGTAISAITYRYDLRDAFLHSALWPFTKTRWAKDFSESKFDLVTAGMNEVEVLDLLGTPLSKVQDSDGGDTYWHYSWRAERCCDQYEGDFHRREIRMTANGAVKGTRREFDAD